ncbi:MAG: transposase [Clostridia bacterium]|nr:transposase [Clostridia bacterium]
MNELPKRKQIRLKEYDYTQNGYYFITVCTHNRQNLFGEIVGATLRGRPNNPDKMIEKWLLKLENKFDDVKICEYIIMPDHLHFIISKTGDHTGSPLRDIVGWFKTMTTNEYIANVKNNIFPQFDKKIWQRNCYEHIIRDENDYITKTEYILNNPLKWELEHIYEE